MEYWDIYDKDGNFTGRKKGKYEKWDKDEYHLATEVWVINSKKQILIQQRSEKCQLLPGIWALTTGRVVSGETTRQGCIRELKEETGYSAKNIKLIHKFFTSAGFSNQKIYIFLATGLNKGEPEFDEDEIIEKYEIDINEARNMVINNEIEDAKTAIGILLAKELI